MTHNDFHKDGKSEQTTAGAEEGRSLLGQSYDQDQDESLISDTESLPESPTAPSPRRSLQRRQSSFAKPRINGQVRTPRTPNRVRFNIEDAHSPETPRTNGHASPRSPLWLDEDDYLHNNGHIEQGAPLLTGITPPSASPFLSDAFRAEDHLPDAKPNSNMRNAFMNMANSIIGAGIIGMPYAFKQAGMTMGIILLMSLTITVDWTIYLIVVNSKLSGADSFPDDNAVLFWQEWSHCDFSGTVGFRLWWYDCFLCNCGRHYTSRFRGNIPWSQRPVVSLASH